MINEDNGYYDDIDNTYFNYGTGTWDDVTDWSLWSTWVTAPRETLYLTFNQQNLGQVETVNILSDGEYRGIPHFYVYYSATTGDFSDEANYSTLHITNGMTNIPSITAQYFTIKLALDYDNVQGFQYFRNINYRVSEDSTVGKVISFGNIDSSTLSGTTSDRVYTVPTTVGAIDNVQITSRGSASYDVDLYVAHSPTSIKTFPQLLSISGNRVHLTFVGIDGRNRDSHFDISMNVNPEWYMDSDGNLKER